MRNYAKRTGFMIMMMALATLLGCATSDFTDDRRQVLKAEFELDCSTKEICWEKVLAGNPQQPKFAIAVPPNMGIEFAVLARKRFGNKVMITRWDGYFVSRSQAVNPAFEQALAYDPFIVEIAPSQPVIERLMASGEETISVPVEVRVRTSILERTFSTQASALKDRFFSSLSRAHKALAPQIFDWMEREVRKTEKAKARN
jgi:hypothetical protein